MAIQKKTKKATRRPLTQKQIDARRKSYFIKNHKVIFDYLFKSSYMPV